MKLIGLSAPLCVRDIASGKVRIEDVKVIYTATKAGVGVDCWKKYLKSFRANDWGDDLNDTKINNFADKAEEIFYTLLSAGKIVEPRITENRWPTFERGMFWVKSEDEIVWHEEKVVSSPV